MLNSVLSNHSEVLGLQELHFVGRQWHPGEKQRWSLRKAQGQAAQLIATARRSIWNARPTADDKAIAEKALDGINANSIDPASVYEGTLACLREEPAQIFVTDQTPRNIYYAGPLLERFPSALVIQMVRDPRAVLLSQKNRWQQRRLGASHIPIWNAIRVFVNYHPITASRLWRSALLAGVQISGHPRYARVIFEEFVANPRASVERLCDWIRIDFEKGMLEVPNVGSSNMPHEATRMGISSDVTDEWKGTLPGADIWICQRMIGALLDKSGYETVNVGFPIVGIAWRLLIYPLHVIGVLLVNPRVAVRVFRTAVRIGRKAN